MKRTLVTAILCASMAFAASAQSISEATAKYDAKAYKASGETYEKAFAQGKGNASDHYNAACSWALAGNKAKAFDNLNKAVALGWDNVGHLKQDTDLTSLHTDKRWNQLVGELEEKVAAQEARYDKPLKAELEQILKTDQGVRQEYQAAVTKYGNNSEEVRQAIQKMVATDQENKKQVTGIIDAHGWPGKSMVGKQASLAAFLVIQHSDKETMEKYLPQLREAAAKGEAEKSQLALMEDRVLMNNGKPQIYGSQLNVNNETGQPELYKIADEANVNKRREEMGLEPLEDYLKRFGIDYQVPQASKAD